MSTLKISISICKQDFYSDTVSLLLIVGRMVCGNRISNSQYFPLPTITIVWLSEFLRESIIKIFSKV